MHGNALSADIKLNSNWIGIWCLRSQLRITTGSHSAVRLNCPCPTGGWECQLTERFPGCDGKYVYHGKHMLHKDMTLSTFPLASYWAFKLWNFHHASNPHSRSPSLSLNYMSLTSSDLQRVKKNWHIKPCCVLVWPMGPLNEARIQCGGLSC